jgi:hypothetical protein
VISGGQQVVSASWIRDATRVQVATSAQRYSTGYGFGWWIGQAPGAEFVFANGYGGQFVVVPSTRLVVAAASRWQGTGAAAANAQWNADGHRRAAAHPGVLTRRTTGVATLASDRAPATPIISPT